MRLPLLILLSTLLGVLGCKSASAESTEEPLREHLWKHRVILVSARTPQMPALQKQLTMLGTSTAGGKRALGERHIVLYILARDARRGCERLLFEPSGETITEQIDAQTCARISRSIDKDKRGEQDFAFLLIGKDGGDKLESKEPVSKDRLFKLIDSMPMRMREMREQKNQGT